MTVRELEELFAAPAPLSEMISPETAAALLPHVVAAKAALIEAAKKAERLGETNLHSRLLLQLCEVDDMRLEMEGRA